MTARAFRFGVTLDRTNDLTHFGATVRRIEQLGYATVLLPDTLRTPAPLPALTAAAALTTRLGVGTWVLCGPLRPPAQLIHEAASVHELLGARFELGLGAGRPDAEADAAALGVPFGTPKERMTQLATTMHMVRERMPELRLLVAASGPKLLALAGAEADIIALGWPPATGLESAAARVAVVRDAADSRFDELELACGLIAVGDSPAPWLTHLGTDVHTLAAAGAISVLTGTPTEMADALRRRRDALGLSYVTVPAAAAETFAPVAELLTGR